MLHCCMSGPSIHFLFYGLGIADVTRKNPCCPAIHTLYLEHKMAVFNSTVFYTLSGYNNIFTVMYNVVKGIILHV